MPRALPELVLFLDHSLGASIVSAQLRASGLRVEVFRDHFPRDSPDSEGLETVGKRGWIVLTKDKQTDIARSNDSR